jgi:hypothetical protein
MKYTLKTWTLEYSGLGFMGSEIRGTLSVDASTIQQARTKATQQLTIYLRLFSVGDKIRFRTISKKELQF